jgi:fructan beta-fructosidase
MTRRTLTTILTAAGLALAQLVVPASVAQAAPDILNPSFETGTLSGWTVLEGTAFSDTSVAAETSYWDRQTFDQHNFWHLRSGRGDDSAIGELRSETFTLAGNGSIGWSAAPTIRQARTSP